MKKFILYFLGYSLLMSVLMAIIYVDRTTTFFDGTRKLVGIEPGMRSPITSSPTIMAVAQSYFTGQIAGAEAKDALFGLRRYPDYRAVLPRAQDGWSRRVPFRIDHRDIAELDFEMLSQVFSGLSLTDFPGMNPESASQIDASVQQVKQEVKDAVLDASALGLGGLTYKASGAYYSDGENEFLIAINKTWQSSFGSINEMGENFANIFGQDTEQVAINGRTYTVHRAGKYVSLEHKVSTKARIYAIGRAPIEAMIAHLETLHLEPIYRHHLGDQTRVAKRTEQLPQLR